MKLWVIPLLVLLSTAAGSAEVPFPPGVSVEIDAAPKIATVGDRILLDLRISAPDGYEIELPHPGNQAGDFSILEFAPDPQEGTSLHARITAAVYKTGKFEFPPLRIVLRKPSGEEVTIASPPADVEIRSVLAEADPKLKDLKKQVELHEERGWALWIALGLIAIAAAIAWLLLRMRKRPAAKPVEVSVQDPLEAAEAELQALLARGIPEREEVKEYYVLLSRIMRRILEAGYGIPAVESTTSEIAASMHRIPSIDSGHAEAVESFLIRCDLVKFAKWIPSREEHAAISQDAVQIAETWKHRPPPALFRRRDIELRRLGQDG